MEELRRDNARLRQEIARLHESGPAGGCLETDEAARCGQGMGGKPKAAAGEAYHADRCANHGRDGTTPLKTV